MVAKGVQSENSNDLGEKDTARLDLHKPGRRFVTAVLPSLSAPFDLGRLLVPNKPESFTRTPTDKRVICQREKECVRVCDKYCEVHLVDVAAKTIPAVIPKLSVGCLGCTQSSQSKRLL